MDKKIPIFIDTNVFVIDLRYKADYELRIARRTIGHEVEKRIHRRAA
jgi:hypothetical protein